MSIAVQVGWPAVGVLLAVLLAFPRRTGLTGVWPFAQLISFRRLLGLGLLALAALVLALPGREGRLALATVLILAAVLQAAVLAARGPALPGPHGGGAGAPPGALRTGGSLVVVAANTQGGSGAADLARLLRATGADVAMLPETAREVADDVAARLASAGIEMQVLWHRGDGSRLSPTALLIAVRLGPYRIDQVGEIPPATFTAVPVDGSGPTLVAVHTRAPGARNLMRAWRLSTAWAIETCRESPGMIAAGDFNATLDHPGFARLDPCVDAAQVTGTAALGTWPASAPSLLSTPIDHVVVDGRRWHVLSVAVLAAVPGSDHRPVVAHLSPR